MIRSSAFTLSFHLGVSIIIIIIFIIITTTFDKEIPPDPRFTEHPIINSHSEHEGHAFESRCKARRGSSHHGSRDNSSQQGTILNLDSQSSQESGF
jgi:hypothetical protein